jgi:cell division protein FtsQ
LRSGNLFSKRDTAVLDAPEPSRASGMKRRAPVTEMPLRRDSAYTDDYADSYDSDPEYAAKSRRPAMRVSFRVGLVPKTLWGRIAAGVVLVSVATVGVAGALWVRSFVLHDDHFLIPSSDAIQIAGNGHLTRAQLLSVFGEDVDRNVFNVPLAQRRAQLESLPWVAHATVMRFLPNQVRVSIVERTPAAFVRQGSQIGLVDANGVLFDMPGPETGDPSTLRGGAEYSFPVLTGISAKDPLSTRTARMRIFLEFMAALDATGEGVSKKLSEVDVSNPEDVKAIIPDQGSDVLVHFGEEKYLERYHQYQQHLAEWKAQYPKLASVDMRYEQQVVLEMQPGTAASAPPPTTAPSTAVPSAAVAPVKAKPAGLKAVAAPAKKKPVTKARVKSVGHAKAAGAGAVGAAR